MHSASHGYLPFPFCLNIKHISQWKRHKVITLESVVMFIPVVSLLCGRVIPREVSCACADLIRSINMAERQRHRGASNESKLSKEALGKVDKDKDSFNDTELYPKLLSAGFYGVSSFVIVVVNKSVLTNYR